MWMYPTDRNVWAMVGGKFKSGQQIWVMISSTYFSRSSWNAGKRRWKYGQCWNGLCGMQGILFYFEDK